MTLPNAMTVDVEDYYTVVARDWLCIDRQPDESVVPNTLHLLDLFKKHNVRCTCFVQGDVAEFFPDLVREIDRQGHEVGVHSYYHRQVFKVTPEEFRKETRRAKKRVESALGKPVLGYRAPAFSIGPNTRWALDILSELGFKYDSSIFPVKGSRYGWPGFPIGIHRMDLPNGRQIIEAPMSVMKVLSKAIPGCGGGYLRHLPYWFTRMTFRRVVRRQPAIAYLHPSEPDTKPGPEWFTTAMANGSAAAQKFHSMQLRNRHTVDAKLEDLMRRYEFAPLASLIQAAGF